MLAPTVSFLAGQAEAARYAAVQDEPAFRWLGSLDEPPDARGVRTPGDLLTAVANAE